MVMAKLPDAKTAAKITAESYKEQVRAEKREEWSKLEKEIKKAINFGTSRVDVFCAGDYCDGFKKNLELLGYKVEPYRLHYDAWLHISW